MKLTPVFLLILYSSLSFPMLSLGGDVDPHQFGTKNLSGTITSGGYPVSGAEITVTNTNTGKTVRTTTNKDGTFAVRNLNLGLYEVTVKVKGYRSMGKTVIVSEGIAGINVDFDIVSEESVLGVIKGTVKADRSSQNLQDSQIDIVDLRTRKSYKVKTDSSGSYKKDGLVPGPYRITITANGYREAKKKAELMESEVKELHFRLKRR